MRSCEHHRAWCPGHRFVCPWQNCNAVASASYSLRVRAGWAAWAARLVATAGLMLAVAAFFVVTLSAGFPAALLDYTYRFPDDGLAPFGRRVLKFSIVSAMHGVAVAVLYGR